MRITLVVPGLLSLPAETLAREPSLSRIAALAEPTPEADLDAALLGNLSLDAAVAPLAACGSGLDVAHRWVIRADPVTMTVGREDARLAGCVLDLDDAERAALLALLNAHFAVDGLLFAAPRADAWFAISEAQHAVVTHPAEHAAGRPLRELLPSGPDAARWRRWLTEAQMLLHDHALATRPRPVNALWFSGGGTLPDSERVPSIVAAAPVGRHADVLRGIASVQRRNVMPAGTLDGVLAIAEGDIAVIALGSVDAEATLARAVQDFVRPALERLERGDVSSLSLIAGGGQVAASWNAQRPSLLSRLRRRRARFVYDPASR